MLVQIVSTDHLSSDTLALILADSLQNYGLASAGPVRCSHALITSHHHLLFHPVLML